MEKDAIQKIKDWHELLKNGLITEDEFAKKKQELLANENEKQTFFTQPEINIPIYQDKLISISKTEIIYKGKTFALDRITDTHIKESLSNLYIPCLLIIIGLISFIIGYTTRDTNLKFDTLYFASLPILLGITWFLWLIKKKFTLIIDVAGTNFIKVTSYDKNKINLINSLLDKNGKVDELITGFDHLEKEKIFYQDNDVKISNKMFRFGHKVLSMNIIEKINIEIDTNKKISKSLLLVGAAIFCFRTFILSGTDANLGLIIIVIGIFYWFRKQNTIVITFLVVSQFERG